MGRWTPLILMAGGLAILLGTLLGINFPMDGRNAEVPTRKRESQVLPANINVNSTVTGSSGENGNQSNVAQNNNNNRRTIRSVPTTTAQGSTSTDSTTPSTSVGQRSSQSNNNAPIRALW
jgi:hypothetical protein